MDRLQTSTADALLEKLLAPGTEKKRNQTTMAITALLVGFFLSGLTILIATAHSLFYLRSDVPDGLTALLMAHFVAIIILSMALWCAFDYRWRELEALTAFVRELRKTDTHLTDIDIARDIQTLSRKLTRALPENQASGGSS